MIKVQNAHIDLHNITKAINYVLFSESTDKEDKQFIFDQVNKIFGSNVSEHSFINDMPWTDPTLKQMAQLNDLIFNLQERYIIPFEGPCMECGKYFMPGEGIYCMGDGNFLCEKCHKKRFKNDRAWNEYIVMANAGGNPESLNDDFDPTSNIIRHLSDEELGKLASQYCGESDAVIKRNFKMNTESKLSKLCHELWGMAGAIDKVINQVVCNDNSDDKSNMPLAELALMQQISDELGYENSWETLGFDKTDSIQRLINCHKRPFVPCYDYFANQLWENIKDAETDDVLQSIGNIDAESQFVIDAADKVVKKVVK